MSAQFAAHVYRFAKVTGAGFDVLLALAALADDNAEVRTTVTELARKTRLPRRVVESSLEYLATRRDIDGMLDGDEVVVEVRLP
jgi:hypothetical protein